MATGSRMLDILAVGAGQAGLALGYHLKTTPFTFQIVDCHRRIGDSWRKRYDSLVLFTPQARDAQGYVLHQRGVSPVPHLYLIGRSWQWTRGSALLTGVGDDAVLIKDHIVKDVGEREQPERVVQIL